MKAYLSDCAKCAIEHAKPIRQLMADLPSDRTVVCGRFAISGMDYFGPIEHIQGGPP